MKPAVWGLNLLPGHLSRDFLLIQHPSFMGHLLPCPCAPSWSQFHILLMLGISRTGETKGYFLSVSLTFMRSILKPYTKGHNLSVPPRL